jgi:predicted Zn finger-like uncharacterized protein
LIIECPGCNAKYNLNEDKIPAIGATAMCKICKIKISLKALSHEQAKKTSDKKIIEINNRIKEIETILENKKAPYKTNFEFNRKSIIISKFYKLFLDNDIGIRNFLRNRNVEHILTIFIVIILAFFAYKFGFFETDYTKEIKKSKEERTALHKMYFDARGDLSLSKLESTIEALKNYHDADLFENEILTLESRIPHVKWHTYNNEFYAVLRNKEYSQAKKILDKLKPIIPLSTYNHMALEIPANLGNEKQKIEVNSMKSRECYILCYANQIKICESYYSLKVPTEKLNSNLIRRNVNCWEDAEKDCKEGCDKAF